MIRVAVAIAPEVRQLLDEEPAVLGEFLEEVHDEDIADLVGLLGKEDGARLLTALTPEQAAKVFERLESGEQEEMVQEIGVEEVAPIVSEMAADDRTDLYSLLPEAMGETLLENIEKVDPAAAADIESLAKWPKDSAGGLMTTDYVAVSPGMTVAQVIEKIRHEGTHAETVYYVYVVGKHGALHGVASLRDILLAQSRDKIEDVMTESVHKVGPDTDQEEVARTMAKYDFSALPVVGPDSRLLGVITVDDVMDVLTEEHGEDVQRIAGIEPSDETYFQTTFWKFIRKRVVWLAVLFVGEFFTGTALRHYDKIIEAVATLAFYVPLLISTGGNSGSQSSSLIIRGLATGEIQLKDWGRVLIRELGQGIVMGVALGAIGAARVMMWGDGTAFAVTIAGTLVGIVTGGCVVGSMFPMLLRKIGLDPATSSAPFIASLVDVLGIVVYFNVAKYALADVLANAATTAH
ncbi:MAG TPA: magnesium transporter [Polyangiaceae bacterium]|jgi:magnesium transporter|nr:magnesium transporter [Polyangiaceae bacterium]